MIAVMQMGLSPDQFWRLSALEWRWLLSAAGSRGARLSLNEAQALAALYPDDGK